MTRAATGFDRLCTLIADLDVEKTSQGLREVADDEVASVIASAREHAVEAWLAGCVATVDSRWGVLAQQRTRFAAARLRQRSEIERVGELCDRIEARWAVVKGAAVAHAWYPRPDLRYAVDVDVLVEPARLREVLAVLQSAGYELLDRNWPLICQLRPGQLKLRSARGVLIDLHWHLLNEPFARSEFNLPTQQLLADRQPVAGLYRLSTQHQLLHLAVHGCLSGGNRLSWLLDLALVLRALPEDAGWIVAAEQARVGPALALLLARAGRIFELPVASAELRRLGGRAWLGAERGVNELSPLGPSSQLPSAARALAHSVRGTGASSLAEFVRHGGNWLRRGAIRGYVRPDWRDPELAASVMFVREDARAMESYFTQLEAAGALSPRS